MVRDIGNLIDECKRLRIELSGLFATEMAMYPPSEIKMVVGENIAKMILENQAELKKECQELGLGEVRRRRDLVRKELDSKYSELASYLDEKGGFELDELQELKAQLNEEQYSWLDSHRVEIKRYLQGVII